MKRIIAVLSIATMLISNVSFANATTEINKKVLKSFQTQFTDAVDVIWVENNSDFVAKFKMKSASITDKQGKLLATSRFLIEQDLPTAVMTGLIKNYSNYAVNTVTEYVVNNQTVYYISLEGDNNWAVVRVDQNGNTKLIQKLGKA
jgi:hypothetical protein